MTAPDPPAEGFHWVGERGPEIWDTRKTLAENLTPCDRDPNCQLSIQHDGSPHAGPCEVPPSAEELRDHAARLLSKANEIDRGKP